MSNLHKDTKTIDVHSIERWNVNTLDEITVEEVKEFGQEKSAVLLDVGKYAYVESTTMLHRLLSVDPLTWGEAVGSSQEMKDHLANDKIHVEQIEIPVEGTHKEYSFYQPPNISTKSAGLSTGLGLAGSNILDGSGLSVRNETGLVNSESNTTSYISSTDWREKSITISDGGNTLKTTDQMYVWGLNEHTQHKDFFLKRATVTATYFSFDTFEDVVVSTFEINLNALEEGTEGDKARVVVFPEEIVGAEYIEIKFHEIQVPDTEGEIIDNVRIAEIGFRSVEVVPNVGEFEPVTDVIKRDILELQKLPKGNTAFNIGWTGTDPLGYHAIKNNTFFLQISTQAKNDFVRMTNEEFTQVIENIGTEAFTIQNLQGTNIQEVLPNEAYFVYDNKSYSGTLRITSGKDDDTMLVSKYIDQFGIFKPNYLPRSNYNKDLDYIDTGGANHEHSILRLSDVALLAKAMVEKYAPKQRSGLMIGNKFVWTRTDALPDFLLPLNGQTINNANLQQPELWAERQHSSLLTYDDQAHSITLKNYNGEGRFARAGKTAGVKQNDSTARPNSAFSGSTNSKSHNHKIPIGGNAGTVAAFGSSNNALGQSSSSTSSSSHSHTVSITSGGDSETRPVNVSEVWCIVVKS